MANSGSIKIGQTNEYLWVRIIGKGNVFLAPTIKNFFDRVLSKDESHLSLQSVILDMEECTGMDSTFMGMIAGTASKLKKTHKNSLSLHSVSPKNLDSLEELGIHFLVKINSQDLNLKALAQEIRPTLQDISPDQILAPDKNLILETHKTLGSLNTKNAKEFKAVINTFEKEISE